MRSALVVGLVGVVSVLFSLPFLFLLRWAFPALDPGLAGLEAGVIGTMFVMMIVGSAEED